MMRVSVVLLLAASAAGIDSAQSRDVSGAPHPVPVGSSVIAGRVVTDEPEPRPLRRVTVTAQLLTRAGTAGQTVTDDDGRFVIGELPAGRYTVSAVKGAYLPSAYGAPRPSNPASVLAGTAVVLGEGERIDDVVVQMTRGGVITGVVRDHAGRPVADLTVSAQYLGRSQATGERSLAAVPVRATTDDRGVYRLFGLPPGEYYVAVFARTPPANDLRPTTDADVRWAQGQIQVASRAAMTGTGNPLAADRATVGYVPTFYPGTTVIDSALPVRLAAGEAREGIDLQTQFVPTTRVVGTAVLSDGQPASGAFVRAVSSGLTMTVLGFGANVDADGRFVLPGLAPGAYAIVAQERGVNEAGGRVAMAEITATGQDVPLDLVLHQGATLSGQLLFDARRLEVPQDRSRLRVSLVPAADEVAARPQIPVFGRPDEGGRFVLRGILPGRYWLTAELVGTRAGQSAWAMIGASIGEADALDRPIEVIAGAPLADALVTLADEGTELAGTITTAAGQPAPEYFLIVFAADPSFWIVRSRRIQQTRPGSDGTYAFRMLPPGDYLLAAVTEIEQGQWFDPVFLQQLAAGAIPVTVSDQSRTVQDIRVR